MRICVPFAKHRSKLYEKGKHVVLIPSQQAATEQEEELITNTLMKRMNDIKADRDRLAMQVYKLY